MLTSNVSLKLIKGRQIKHRLSQIGIELQDNILHIFSNGQSSMLKSNPINDFQDLIRVDILQPNMSFHIKFFMPIGIPKLNMILITKHRNKGLFIKAGLHEMSYL